MTRNIGKTADGAVVFNRPKSHMHDEVNQIIVEALSRVHTLGRPFIEVEVDFGKVIGTSICVETSEHDCIVFAQRPNRNGLSRFVLDREPVPSTKAMIVLKKADDLGGYILITAFIGSKSEVEPWDLRANKESLKFWHSHALVWGTEPIIKGTATTEYPWQGCKTCLLP